MKKQTIAPLFFLGALGTFAVLGLKGYQKAMEKLRVTIVDFAIPKRTIHLLNSVVRVTVNVYNPNPINLAYNGFIGEATIGGKLVAEINHKDEKLFLPAEGNTRIPIEFELHHITALSSIINIIKNLIGKKPAFSDLKEIIIQGNLRAGKATFPISQKINLNAA